MRLNRPSRCLACLDGAPLAIQVLGRAVVAAFPVPCDPVCDDQTRHPDDHHGDDDEEWQKARVRLTHAASFLADRATLATWD